MSTTKPDTVTTTMKPRQVLRAVPVDSNKSVESHSSISEIVLSVVSVLLLMGSIGYAVWVHRKQNMDKGTLLTTGLNVFYSSIKCTLKNGVWSKVQHYSLQVLTGCGVFVSASVQSHRCHHLMISLVYDIITQSL